MKPDNSAPERNAFPEKALAYNDANTAGLICFVCGKRQYEQEGLVQCPEEQICQCVCEFYNVFI